MVLNEIKLNDDVSIYKTKYNWARSKESFLNRINQNLLFSPFTHDNTSRILFDCPEFNNIKEICFNNCKKLSNLPEDWDDAHICLMWFYKQDKNYKSEFYHKHIYAYPSQSVNSKFTIINEWTFVFYLQIPNDMTGEQGKLYFDYGDDVYKFLPEEGDIIIFPATLSHMVKSNLNSETNRISICGNISFNIPKITNKELI